MPAAGSNSEERVWSAEPRTIFTEAAPHMTPAHLVAALEERGLRYHIGPPGTALANCEVVAIQPTTRWEWRWPFWNEREWRRDPLLPIAGLLRVQFGPHGATCQVQQPPLRLCLVPVPFALLLGGAFTTIFMMRRPEDGWVAFIPGLIGAAMLLLAVYTTWHAIHVHAPNRRALLDAWQRAQELARGRRTPLPTVTAPPPLPVPWWPEKRIQRGILVFAERCAPLTPATFEALIDTATYEICTSRSMTNTYVLTKQNSRATFRHSTWGGTWDQPQARLIVRCEDRETTAELRRARPLTGVIPVIIVGVLTVYFAIRAGLVANPFATGEIFAIPVLAVIGAVCTLALRRRRRAIAEELQALRGLWAQIRRAADPNPCGESHLTADSER